VQLRLNDNEKELVAAVERVVRGHLDGPRSGGISVATYSAWSEELHRSLREAGFFEVARTPEFGPVCGALLIEEVCKSPMAAEVGTSALVAPMACDTIPSGPIALCRAEDLGLPIRYLSVAKTLLVLSGESLLALDVDRDDVRVNGGMYAYPFGTFTRAPDLRRAITVGSSSQALIYWHVAIAAEGAALMQAVLDYTVDYVKNRRQFNRPIGSFQAIKHRLAACAQQVRGATWLARRAAWSGTAGDAAMAALYTQQTIPEVTYDCHQFSGAMGMTLECPLHFWTHRLKALQGELGGAAFSAGRLAHEHWAA
jgi:alkylation response protein AidB-like acyl-CoA dehydrogenase